MSIDPGSKSGATIHCPTISNRLDFCATIRPLSPDPDRVMEYAVHLSSIDGAPLFVVIEEPGMGGDFGGPRTVFGMGQTFGMWRRAAVCAGIPEARIVAIQQATWIPAIMGSGATGRLDREGSLARAMELAPLLYGRALAAGESIAWTEDAAMSALLGNFALRAPLFLDTIGVQDRARAAKIATAAGFDVRESLRTPPDHDRM